MRLKAITNTASLLIDGTSHKQLSDGYLLKDMIRTRDENPSYYRLHQQLNSIKEINKLESDIYTIVYYPPDSTFHFIGTSSVNPYFRHSYKNYPKELLTHYDTGGTINVYEDENGTWLSAFAPIKDNQGKIVALVEADENFESFLEKAKMELFKNSLISLVIVGPFVVLLLGFVSSLLRKQAETQTMLQEQNEEIKAQNEEIKSQNEIIELQNQELDQKVKERTLALTRSNQQLSSFIYHSSHDVQAPIATLKGILTLAEMDLKDEKAGLYISMFRDTMARLDMMVKTLQIVHEIKSRELLIELVNISILAQGVLHEIINAEEENYIQCNIDEALTTQTDYTILQTILRELVKNAVHYSSRKGTITVSATVSENNKLLNIIVDDQGDGIPLSLQHKLFSLFTRNHENSNGMGLGLFIARTCTERLQGTLSLLMKEEKGARFLLCLPRSLS